MNTQQRWHYIKNNDEILVQHMALHDDEVKTRRLLKFLGKETDNMEFDFEHLVQQLHDIARKLEQQVGIGEFSRDIRACADRLSDLGKHTP